MLLQGIRDDARFLISPKLTSTQYPDALLDKNVNEWYLTVLGWIIPTQGEWEIQGDYLTIDLEANINEYEIPVGLIRLFKAELMYKDATSYVPATQYDMQRNQETSQGNENILGSNIQYPLIEVIGDFFRISPTPTEDVVNGFKIWAQLPFDEITETLDLPNINPIVHRALSTGAAIDWASAKGMSEKTLDLKRRMFGDSRVPDDIGLKGQIINLYSIRTGDRRDRATIKRVNYR